jgi:hydroxyacylglutathione hydrolase
MTLHPIAAFTDNYIWMLHDGRRAVVVDPGDAQPVLVELARLNLALQAILVTHHHPDHVGGLADLLSQHPAATVYGPTRERIPVAATAVSDGDEFRVLDRPVRVIDVPGHTKGHVAFFLGAQPTPEGRDTPILFCGDTLFSGGCGRLFEGTPAQMHASLAALAALPGPTRVCCAHEYTLSNLRFARTVEPDNAALAAYEARCVALREAGLPTLPSSIEVERAINPFLRCEAPGVVASARQRNADAVDAVAVLATLREWKNVF